MRGSRGFTLIEMVVVIAVLGILMTILIGITRAVVSQQRYQTTRARMANIDNALAVYVSTNKRLPCPADGRIASSATNAGIEQQSGTPRTCTNNQQYGVVPWVALGLTSSDVEDGWAGRFTYRVGPDLVIDGGMDFTYCDPAGTNPAPAAVTPPWCSNTCSATALNNCTTPAIALTPAVGKGVVVENVAGSVLMDPRGTNPVSSPSVTTGAAYVLISHGPEGGGAYSGAGILSSSSVNPGTMEAKNFANIAYAAPVLPVTTAPTSFLVDDVINATATTAHFDDMVSRVGILSLAMKAQTGPRSH